MRMVCDLPQIRISACVSGHSAKSWRTAPAEEQGAEAARPGCN